ncbi:MAG: FtsX-like permease family protein, partial [Chloroflexota bacterium]
NAFRSLAILVVAALVAGLALIATVIVRGAEASLRTNLSRLGADILVLPWGTMTEKIEGIRLMSAPIEGWMPRNSMEKVAAVDGVAAVSPQLYLASLEDSPYSPYPQIHLVAFDPATDFTLRPWLAPGRLADLAEGDAIAGAYFTLPVGSDEFSLFGTPLKLVDRLAPTETSIDNTLFVSFETADQMILRSQGALNIIPGTISAIMVRLTFDSDPHQVAGRILEDVPGVTPLETPNMFQTERRQMIGILRTLLGSLVAIWILAVVFMGLVFSIAVNERRFEIGALRAIGFPSRLIFRTLLMEGATLAIIGGFAGILITNLGFAAFGDQLMRLANLPLSFPSIPGLISFSLGGQTLALVSVTLAGFIPAWRISHEEVAMTMRE